MCSEHYCGGRANWFTVSMSASVVKKLGHIGEGFGTERAPVERLRCMGFPRKWKKNKSIYYILVNGNIYISLSGLESTPRFYTCV